MDAIRSLTTAAFVVATTIALIPADSLAQGQLDASKRTTILKFKKNVQKLDQLAKTIVTEAKADAKIYQGETSELHTLSRHSELTGNLVKATLIGNPAVLRQASLDVDNHLKRLKSVRSKSKNPKKIDKLIRVSTAPTNYIVKNLEDFNDANLLIPGETPSVKKQKPGKGFSNLFKKTFKQGQ